MAAIFGSFLNPRKTEKEPLRLNKLASGVEDFFPLASAIFVISLVGISSEAPVILAPFNAMQNIERGQDETGSRPTIFGSGGVELPRFGRSGVDTKGYQNFWGINEENPISASSGNKLALGDFSISNNTMSARELFDWYWQKDYFLYDHTNGTMKKLEKVADAIGGNGMPADPVGRGVPPDYLHFEKYVLVGGHKYTLLYSSPDGQTGHVKTFEPAP